MTAFHTFTHWNRYANVMKLLSKTTVIKIIYLCVEKLIPCISYKEKILIFENADGAENKRCERHIKSQTNGRRQVVQPGLRTLLQITV